MAFKNFDNFNGYRNYINSKYSDQLGDINVEYNVLLDDSIKRFYLAIEVRNKSLNQMLNKSRINLEIDTKDIQNNPEILKEKYLDAIKLAETNLKNLFRDPQRSFSVRDSFLKPSTNKDFNYIYLTEQLNHEINSANDKIKPGYGIMVVKDRGHPHEDGTILQIGLMVDLNHDKGDYKDRKGHTLESFILYYPGSKNDGIDQLVKKEIADNHKDKKISYISTPPKHENIIYSNAEEFLAALESKLKKTVEGRKEINDPKIKIFSDKRFSVTYQEGSNQIFNISFNPKNIETNKLEEAVEKIFAQLKESSGISRSANTTGSKKQNQPVIPISQNKPGNEQAPTPENEGEVKTNWAEVAELVKNNKDFFKFALILDKAITEHNEEKVNETNIQLFQKDGKIFTMVKSDKNKENTMFKSDEAWEYIAKYMGEEVKARITDGDFSSSVDHGGKQPNPDSINEQHYRKLINTYNDLRNQFKGEKGIDFESMKEFIRNPASGRSIL